MEAFKEPAAEDSYNLELKEALAVLDEKYRVVMMLFYGEGYRIREIAKLLNISQSTVQTRLDRGRKKLKSYYAADHPESDEQGYITLNAQDSILVQKSGLGCVLGASDKKGISYCIGTNFLCEGENIESITYSINGAAFQVVERPNESVLIASEPYDKKLNTGLVGGEDSDTLDNPTSVSGLYKSFTLSYDNQMNDYTWINICNETEYSWDFLYGKNMTLEDRVNAIEKMMSIVEIICRVHYTDGTTGDARITVGGGIYVSETGVPKKDVPIADFEFRLEP